VSGLREALEAYMAMVEDGIAKSRNPNRDGFIDFPNLRRLFAAHPAAQVVDRAVVREEIRAGLNSALCNGGMPGTGWSQSAEVDRVTDAVLALLAEHPADLDLPALRQQIGEEIADAISEHGDKAETKPAGYGPDYWLGLGVAEDIARKIGGKHETSPPARSEATVKAEALEEAAAWIIVPEGQSVAASQWLHERARQLRAGDTA
jgi:hypothetical protein